jgi:hypothetical protein
MVPVAQEAHTRQPYSTLTEMVAIRGKHQPCFLRVAEAPFDFLPFRQAADIRRGAWFTLGPGVVSGERSPMGWTGRIHPAVVLLQIEGSPDEVNLLAEPLFAVLTDFGVQVQIADCTDAAGWLCRCAAGVLPESQPADMIWRGQP